MFIWHRLMAKLQGHKIIRLEGEEREGGYIFMTSSDLPGFSFLLEPNEANDARTLMAAMGETLAAYLQAEDDAKNDGREPVRITGVSTPWARREKSEKLVADLCYA